MQAAMKMVIDDNVPIREAAVQCGVPRSTLQDRIHGRVLPGSVSGPKPYLTRNEENELVNFLVKSAAIGYARTRNEVIAMIEQLLTSRANGHPQIVSSGWWQSFAKRHPEVTLRKSAPLSIARMKGSHKMAIDKYFDILEDTLTENDLYAFPHQIFNMDETGMSLDCKPLKTIHRRGAKNPTHIPGTTKSNVTVVACAGAGGQCLPPMVIWKGKRIRPELAEGEVRGTLYGLSENGWMDQGLFDMWFRGIFLRYSPAARPLLLLLDGHSSHYCPETIHLAASQKVVLFTLPPNSTHLTQPLDRGVFGPLKVAWRQVCHEFLIDNPGQTVNHRVFSRLLAEAYMRAMTVKNIIAGFRKIAS